MASRWQSSQSTRISFSSCTTGCVSTTPAKTAHGSTRRVSSRSSGSSRHKSPTSSHVTIRTDVPVDVEFEALKYRGGSRERCYELFSRLAFRTLVNDYAPTAENIQKDYRLVTTLTDLDALIDDLR